MKKTRDTSKDYAEVVKIPKEAVKKYKHINYDSALKIVIYGEPFTDTRPRINMNTMGVGLVNMNKFKVVFKDLYNRSELLQNLTIVSPFHMRAKFYKKPTQEEMRFIKKSQKLLKLYRSEQLGVMAIKDCDNMLKIHNDILFEPEFRITLDDAWNLGFEEPEKYLSDNPRAEITIYYSSSPNSFYVWKMKQSSKYYRWLISEKHMRQHNRDWKKQMKFLKSVTKDALKECKNADATKSVVKRTLSVLEEYPASSIKMLADMNDKKYTKEDAQYKVISELVRGDKVAEELVEGIQTITLEETAKTSRKKKDKRDSVGEIDSLISKIMEV